MPLPLLAASVFSVPGFTEPVSSWTHLGAAGLAFVLGVMLVRQGRDLAARISLGVFVFSAVFLLSMSGVYHLLDLDGGARQVMQRLDHAGIWGLIAGTFTPVHIIAFRGWFWRWAMTGIIWVIAITGLVLTTVFFDELPDWASLSFYLGLGWVGALTGLALHRRGAKRELRGLIGGGLAYTVGALAEGMQWPTLIPGVIGPHELFHIAVLVGLGIHWFMVRDMATSFDPSPAADPSDLDRSRVALTS